MFGQYQFDPAGETDAVPIREQLETLTGLVKAGKVRHIGLSNEHPGGSWNSCAWPGTWAGTGGSIQNPYNLINRTFETGLAEVAFRERLGLLAYSPLAFGHLSGKYQADPAASGRVTLFKGFAQRYEKPNVPAAVAAYRALAGELGMTPARMALAFVYRRWFVASTIIGATTMAQLRENLDAWTRCSWRRRWRGSGRRHLRHFNPAP